MRHLATVLPAFASVGTSVAVPSPMPAICNAPAESSLLPMVLLRPLLSLFEHVDLSPRERFLDGLSAEGMLGATLLTPRNGRSIPLAWVGVALRAKCARLFDDLRGGCWVPGFPAVGRERELLRRAGFASEAQFEGLEQELGLAAAEKKSLYFNFQPIADAGGCERVYVLDASECRLHGFAVSTSALAVPGWK